MSDPRPGYSLPLAHGELSDKDAIELKALKDMITKDLGFASDGYKEHCLRRRIAVRLRARGVHTYAEYARLLKNDQAEHRKLLDAVTINVSKFYRNRELWRSLDQLVIPKLFDWRARPIRCWSAGCAAGEEPYTIAMTLREYANRNGRERELSKFSVLGTDIDQESLALAKQGKYGSFAFTDIEKELREHWFQPPDHTEVKPEIRRMVKFETCDLIKETFDTGYHLIFCRNVIIYFEREIQEQLFMKFHDALAPGGFLVLGKVETLFGRAASTFKSVAQRDRVFVKA